MVKTLYFHFCCEATLFDHWSLPLKRNNICSEAEALFNHLWLQKKCVCIHNVHGTCTVIYRLLTIKLLHWRRLGVMPYWSKKDKLKTNTMRRSQQFFYYLALSLMPIQFSLYATARKHFSANTDLLIQFQWSLIWCFRQDVTYWVQFSAVTLHLRLRAAVLQMTDVSLSLIDVFILGVHLQTPHLQQSLPVFHDLHCSQECVLDMQQVFFFMEINEVNGCGWRRINWIRCVCFWSGNSRRATLNTSSPHCNTWISPLTIIMYCERRDKDTDTDTMEKQAILWILW